MGCFDFYGHWLNFMWAMYTERQTEKQSRLASEAWNFFALIQEDSP